MSNYSTSAMALLCVCALASCKRQDDPPVVNKACSQTESLVARLNGNTYSYDASSRISIIRDAAGNVLKAYAYDGNTVRVAYQESAGRLVHYTLEFDASGNLVYLNFDDSHYTHRYAPSGELQSIARYDAHRIREDSVAWWRVDSVAYAWSAGAVETASIYYAYDVAPTFVMAYHYHPNEAGLPYFPATSNLYASSVEFPSFEAYLCGKPFKKVPGKFVFDLVTTNSPNGPAYEFSNIARDGQGRVISYLAKGDEMVNGEKDFRDGVAPSIGYRCR